MHSFLTAITDIGESAVLGAITVVSVCYLLAARCRREAMALAVSFLLTAFCMVVMKTVVWGCGTRFYFDTIHSPSGHAALSAAVLGTIAVIMMGRLRGWWRFVPALILGSLILLIALTRIWLGFHTPVEVVIGLGIGMAIAGLIYRALIYRQPVQSFGILQWMLWMALVMVVLHGIRLPVEIWLHTITSKHICPVLG